MRQQTYDRIVDGIVWTFSNAGKAVPLFFVASGWLVLIESVLAMVILYDYPFVVGSIQSFVDAIKMVFFHWSQVFIFPTYYFIQYVRLRFMHIRDQSPLNESERMTWRYWWVVFAHRFDYYKYGPNSSRGTEYIKWCQENCKSLWVFPKNSLRASSQSIFFLRKKDMVMFKLANTFDPYPSGS